MKFKELLKRIWKEEDGYIIGAATTKKQPKWWDKYSNSYTTNSIKGTPGGSWASLYPATTAPSGLNSPDIGKSYKPPVVIGGGFGGATGTSNLSSFGSTGMTNKSDYTPSEEENPVVTNPVVTGGEGYGGEGYGGEGYGGYPEFSVDLAGIWDRAGMLADNEINPQLAEIDRLLTEAGYSADESQRAIAEAYPLARRSLQKSIYENMTAGEGRLAAMGTGRGGGRQELLARAGEREAVGIEGIETAKTREVGAINRALASYRGQMGNQKVSLEGQRGNLRAGYAEQLRGNRFNEAGMAYNARLGMANLTEGARQFDASMATRTSGSGSAGNSYDNMIFDPETGVYITYTQYLQKKNMEGTGTTDNASKSYVEILEEAAAKAAYRNLLGNKGNQTWNTRPY